MNQFGPSTLINLSNFSSIKPEPASTPPQSSMANSTTVAKMPGTPSGGGRLSPESNQVTSFLTAGHHGSSSRRLKGPLPSGVASALTCVCARWGVSGVCQCCCPSGPGCALPGNCAHPFTQIGCDGTRKGRNSLCVSWFSWQIHGVNLHPDPINPSFLLMLRSSRISPLFPVGTAPFCP